jgi:hypothetical protein
MAMRFEILHEGDVFFFQLRTADGDVILRSLDSPSKIMTQSEILHLRSSLQEGSRLVPHTSTTGEHFIVVKDADGSVLAKSARVATEEELQALRERIVEAAQAPIVDLSKRRAS